MSTLRTRFRSGPMVIVILISLFWGCGQQDDITTESDPHAGHDHPPGQHLGEEQITTSASELDWCAEHSVPESECTFCNPELVDQFRQTGDWCGGHGLPESHCRLCNPGIEFPQEEVLRELAALTAADEISVFLRPNALVCATNNAIIQFANTSTAERAGLTTQVARTGRRELSLEAPAEVVFDETQTTVITSTVQASVIRWKIAPGELVVSGQILAVVQSPEIAELQSQLISARAEYEVQQKEVERHEELMSRNLISQSDYDQVIALGEQARAEFESHRGLLMAAGLSHNDVDRILAEHRISNEFSLRAPVDGLVIERIAQVGELLNAGSSFARMADPKAMWIEARLTEEQLRQVRIGHTLTFSSDGYGMNRVGAKVIWVSRFLDPHTRTGTLRARVVDPQHRLRAGEFGRATIVDAQDETVTLVPKDAVQWEGCCNVVFVEETIGRYRPRKVEFIRGSGPYYQVTSGVSAGENIVINGAFLLKTELKKTSLGAGCCGLEPTG